MEEVSILSLQEVGKFISENFRYIANWIINQFIFALVFGAGLIAVIKGFFLFQSFWLYSVMMLAFKRKKFYEHPVFRVLELKNHTNDQFNSIHDHGKREILRTTFYIELKQTKFLLKRILKFVLKDSVLTFISSAFFRNTKLTRESFLEHCLVEILAYRNSISDYFRIRLRKDMTQEDINIYIMVYYEFTEVFYRQVVTNLQIFKNRKNLYGLIWQLLDLYESVMICYLEIIEKKISRANGRLKGIRIKGYTVG